MLLNLYNIQWACINAKEEVHLVHKYGRWLDCVTNSVAHLTMLVQIYCILWSHIIPLSWDTESSVYFFLLCNLSDCTIQASIKLCLALPYTSVYHSPLITGSAPSMFTSETVPVPLSKNWLILRCKGFSGHLIILQHFKDSHVLKLEISYRSHNNLLLYPILSQLSPRACCLTPGF